MPANPVLIFIFLSALFSESPCPDQPVAKGSIAAELKPLQGYWQDDLDPRYLLSVEGSQIAVSYDGRVREISTVTRIHENDVTICYSGRDVKTVLTASGGQLIFRDALRNQAHSLSRLRQKPPSLCLSSFRLPAASSLSEARVTEIQRELGQRSKKDQDLLRRSRDSFQPTRPAQPPWLASESQAGQKNDLGREIQLAGNTLENTEYIRNLLSEVGWIDVSRFGFGASNAAFLLVQHSWDIPIMMAVLPQLKADVDRGLMGRDAYVLLYDRLQLALGRPQLYGSQIARDDLGIYVLPTVDPAHVEDRRREAGLIPLLDYVRVFGGETVRFSPECASSVP